MAGRGTGRCAAAQGAAEPLPFRGHDLLAGEHTRRQRQEQRPIADRAGCRGLIAAATANAGTKPRFLLYPIPASHPACVLVSDQASMNCGSNAGTIEKPARPRISAAHMTATIGVEGAAVAG